MLVGTPIAHVYHCQLQVLKYETVRQPHALGGSVFGYNDAYKRLHAFLRKWRAAQPGPPHSCDNPRRASSPVPQLSNCPMPASPITQQPQMSSDTAEVDTAAAPESVLPVHKRQGGRHTLPTAAAGMAGGGGQKAGVCAVPYIVSVDVSRAFDNVDADLLLGIVEPLLRSPEYLIIQYTEVCLLMQSTPCLPFMMCNNQRGVLAAAQQHHVCSLCH